MQISKNYNCTDGTKYTYTTYLGNYITSPISNLNLFFHKGYGCFLQRKLGEAQYFLEIGEQLGKSSDKRVDALKEEVQKRIILKKYESLDYDQLNKLVYEKTALISFSLAFGLLIVLIVKFLKSKQVRIKNYFCFLLIIILFTCGGYYYGQKMVLGVVLNDTEIFFGPEQNFKTKYRDISLGRNVIVTSVFKDWVQIYYSQSVYGWIPRQNVGLIYRN